MSELNVTTIGNQNGTKTVPAETVVAGSAKAWVNFNGTGTVAINDSFNVSSITDNATGDYTINFTNSMSSVNYSVTMSAVRNASNSDLYATLKYTGTYSTAGFQIVAAVSSVVLIEDSPIVNAIVFSN